MIVRANSHCHPEAARDWLAAALSRQRTTSHGHPELAKDLVQTPTARKILRCAQDDSGNRVAHQDVAAGRQSSNLRFDVDTEVDNYRFDDRFTLTCDRFTARDAGKRYRPDPSFREA